MVVSAAVEGVVDDAVVRRLLRETAHEIGPVHVKNGKPAVLDKLRGYNAAARNTPWLVLLDLNGDAACAPSFMQTHLPDPAEQMHLRLAIRQVEAWLMADRANFAAFLRVSQARVPTAPEQLPDAKEALVNVARESRDRALREGLVPPPGAGRKVGPAYVAAMIDFVETRWDPTVATERSDSLRRCLSRLHSLT